MQKIYRNFIISLTCILAVVAYVSLSTVHTPSEALAASEGSTSYLQAITSSGVLVTTSSTQVVATSTARTFLTISNLSGSAIYCSMNTNNLFAASPAVSYQGVTIFASSTYTVSLGNYNLYKGPINCITPAGTASTTVYQR